jgi:hypothetical protein
MQAISLFGHLLLLQRGDLAGMYTRLFGPAREAFVSVAC